MGLNIQQKHQESPLRPLDTHWKLSIHNLAGKGIAHNKDFHSFLYPVIN